MLESQLPGRAAARNKGGVIPPGARAAQPVSALMRVSLRTPCNATFYLKKNSSAQGARPPSENHLIMIILKGSEKDPLAAYAVATFGTMV